MLKRKQWEKNNIIYPHLIASCNETYSSKELRKLQEKMIIEIKRFLVRNFGSKSFGPISEFIPQVTKLFIDINGEIHVIYKGKEVTLEKISFNEVYLIAHYLIANFLIPKAAFRDLQTLHLKYHRQVQCLATRALLIKDIKEIITYNPHNQVHISNAVVDGSLYSFLIGTTNNLFVGIITNDGNIDYTYMGHFNEFQINNMIDVLATTF